MADTDKKFPFKQYTCRHWPIDCIVHFWWFKRFYQIFLILCLIKKDAIPLCFVYWTLTLLLSLQLEGDRQRYMLYSNQNISDPNGALDAMKLICSCNARQRQFKDTSSRAGRAWIGEPARAAAKHLHHIGKEPLLMTQHTYIKKGPQ